MDFEIDKSYLELKKEFRAFGNELNKLDKNSSNYFEEAWKLCSDFGLCGLLVSEEYSGAGFTPMQAVFSMEGLGYGCDDDGLLFAINNHLYSCTMPILKHGTKEQKERFLPKLATGEYIGAHAMTEPNSGSDSFSMNACAKENGDSYILNGNKCFITNAPLADVYIVFAKTSTDKELNNVSAFIVEKGMKGFYLSENVEKIGLKNAPMGELVFDDCRVPKENMLGKPGDGFLVFSTAVEWERSCMFATHLGRMKKQLDVTVAYAKSRQQFHRPIGNFQSVSNKIANMKMNVEIAELLLYKTAWLKQNGKGNYLESSITKLFISEAYIKSSLEQLQIHGASGYLLDSGIGSQVVDSLASTIYAGTSEIQRGIISRWLGIKEL